MTAQAQTLARLYQAFASLDPDTMASCYAPDVDFDDEVFSLKGRDQTMGMWRMLCTSIQAEGRDVWRLEFRGIEADGQTGRAHWEAHYRFSRTGRLVHNIIDAQFTFDAQGLIQTHRDSFNFWRWARQALGAPGILLGWTPVVRNQVRAQAAANLRRFMSQQPAA